jgi:hypothetical protein
MPPGKGKPLDEILARDDYDRVNIGGLMRCCTETIGDLYPDGPAKVATQGQTLQCKYITDNRDHRMIFENGWWHWDLRWDLPEDPEP